MLLRASTSRRSAWVAAPARTSRWVEPQAVRGDLPADVHRNPDAADRLSLLVAACGLSVLLLATYGFLPQPGELGRL